MKKILALMLALSISMLAACSSSNSSAPISSAAASSAASSAAPAAPATIKVWHMYAEDQETTKTGQRLLTWAEEFNATNTDNITVEVSGAKTADVIMTTIASGSTPDIFQNYWNNAPTWANNGALYDLTEFVNNDTEWDKDDIMDAAWNVCIYDSKVYSIPLSYSSTFMFYNKDVLAEAGWNSFPATMEELAQCIKDCTKVDANGTITQIGMIPDYPWLDNVLWPVAFGAEYIDETTNTITFDSEDMIAAYQFQRDIYDEYGYTEVKRFQDTLGARTTIEDPLFTGKVAMRWQADSALASLEENGTAANWGIAEFPAANGKESYGMLSCGVWEMNAKTKNAEAAWKVLASLTSKETMATLAKGDYDQGAFMPRNSSLKALQSMDVSDNCKLVANYLLEGTMRSFPMSSYVGEYLTVINTEMSAALSGDISVVDAAKLVVEQVQPLADAAK